MTPILSSSRCNALRISAILWNVLKIVLNHPTHSFYNCLINNSPSSPLFLKKIFKIGPILPSNNPIPHDNYSRNSTAFLSPTSMLQSLPRPIRQILQLLQCQENQNCRWLQTCERGHPAFEHEHCALVFEGAADHCYGWLFEWWVSFEGLEWDKIRRMLHLTQGRRRSWFDSVRTELTLTPRFNIDVNTKYLPLRRQPANKQSLRRFPSTSNISIHISII